MRMRSGAEVRALTRLALAWLELTPPPNRYLHFNRTGTCTLTPTTQRVQRGQPSGVSSTGLGTSHYGRRTCGKKKNTSPLLSDKTVIPYHSYVPSPPPYRNHLHHQRRSQMRNQMMKNPKRKRRSSHWQSGFHPVGGTGWKLPPQTFKLPPLRF